jgi:hypothetical protein
MSGPTASARFDGSVHGVVVHTSSRDEQPRAVVQLEPDGDDLVLALAGRVVEARLEGGQRGLALVAVGQDLVALVDQALVPQLLEDPHRGLHEGRVHRLVVVDEVDPPRLARDVAVPAVGVLHDRSAARLVEVVDAVLGDGHVAGDAQLALGLHLGRQAVAVPAEAALDAAAPHGLVAGDRVLHVPGQQVAVVGQPVGERGPVVEDVLVAAVHAGVTLVDARLERAVLGPERDDALLQLGEAGLLLDAREGGIPCGRAGRAIGHRHGP